MPKKSKASSGTVNVAAVKREVRKMVQQYDPKPQKSSFDGDGRGEAAPGTISRQSPLEQEIGTNKYRQMIHDHNEKNKHILDRLPFQFPKKKIVRSHLNILLICPECGDEKCGSENTVAVICGKCKRFVHLKNPEAEFRGYNPDLNVGFNGNNTDRLNLKEKLGKKQK